MDLLKSEILKKRKANEALHKNGEQVIGSSKFVRLIDRKKQEDLLLQQEQEKLDRERSEKQIPHQIIHGISSSGHRNVQENLVDLKQSVSIMKMGETEVKRRLRALGSPITLFGESGKDRQDRLIEVMKNSQKFNQKETEDDEFKNKKIMDDDEEAELEADDLIEKNQVDNKEMTSDKNNKINKVEEDSGDEDDDNEMKLFYNPSIQYSKMSHLSQEKIVYKFFRCLIKQWELVRPIHYLLNIIL